MSSLERVLTGRGVRVHKVLEDRISIFCPMHKGGQERKASMSLYFDRLWVVCFTCGYSKPLDRFLQDMGMPRATAEEVSGEHKRAEKPKRDPEKLSTDLAGWVGMFKSRHPKKLLDLGFTSKTLSMFRVGFDATYRRVTYPVYDRYGALVAIVGGAIDEVPSAKYKLYDEEIGLPRGARQYHRDHLWGLNLYPDAKQLVVVEGYKAAMWVAQAGFAVCATQGARYTKPQVNTLADVYTGVLVMLDQDEAGMTAGTALTKELISRVGRRARMFRYPRPDAKQPDWMPVDELTEAIQAHGGEKYGVRS